MSQYFILLPGDTEKDTVLDSNLLGESSFKSFYPGAGLRALLHIIDRIPEVLPDVRIFNDVGRKFSVEEFLDILNEYRVYSDDAI